MLTEHSVRSSSSSTTTPSTSAASIDPDFSPLPSPSTELTPTLQHGGRPLTYNTISDSKRSDALSYSPHAVGLGLAAPRPHRAPLAPFSADMSRQPPASSSQQLTTNPLESLSQQEGASVVNSQQGPSGTSPSDPASIYIEPAPRPHVDPPAAPAAFSTLSLGSLEQRSPSPGPRTGLSIAIPPPHHAGNPFVHSGTTPSPPLSGLSSVAQQPEGLSSPSQAGANSIELAPPAPPDPAESALSLDLAEFESEGLSALEKIYLFSRSPAGFQRVFIAHALPGYLRYRREADQAQAPADELSLNEGSGEAGDITPAEAVEYVLPLLNGLAMDEDEAVKEALAAELVPIIWWFITHCRLVEDDGFGEEPPTLLPEEPTRISVQSFTPILGTLLLSTNNHIGDPARYAVVELLNRVRRADARDRRESDGWAGDALEVGNGGSEQQRTVGGAGTLTTTPDAEEDGYSPIGHFGSMERRLFEREMVQQLVIGMGRLDLPEESAGMIPEPEVPEPSDAQGFGSQDSYFPAVHFVQIMPTVDDSWASSTSNLESQPSPPANPNPDRLDYAPPTSQLAPHSFPGTPSGSADEPSSHSPGTVPSHSFGIEDYQTAQVTSPPLSPRSLGRELEAMEDRGPVAALRTHSPRPQSPRLAHVYRSSSPRPASPRPSSLRPSSPLPTSDTTSDPMMQPHGLEHPMIPTIESRTPFIPDIVTPTPDFAHGMLHSDLHEPADTEEPSATPQGSQDDEATEDAQLNEEASVGRLSSMSLVAAVTASGSIDDETKAAFVAEVERVGRDPVYWVRKEASFAVGALAKVVPQEVVLITLLPLFETLYRDTSGHVRHSTLFALPAILSRLEPRHRRTLALDVITTLASDESRFVRLGVLEALAEVITTFQEDTEGPPDRLLRLFLGVREEDDARNLEQPEEPPPLSPPPTSMSWSEFVSSVSSAAHEAIEERDIYEDPSRPLVCAFNYPAVALTLGRDRWHEIRELYLELSENPSVKVRRTLAASLGEIAKIVGPEHAKEDLVRVWWNSTRADESEVRLKAVECLETFLPALGDAEQSDILKGLNGDVWSRLKTWREREAVMKALGSWASIIGLDETVLRGLLRKGLQDTVASVREESVTALAAMAAAWSARPQSLEHLWDMLRTLAISSSYRHRMTFLAGYQTTLLSLKDTGLLSEPFLQRLRSLGTDSIVDVRIRTARLLGSVIDGLPNMPDAAYRAIEEIARALLEDPSHDVQAFARSLLSRPPPTQNSHNYEAVEATKHASVFSRPPPLAPS